MYAMKQNAPYLKNDVAMLVTVLHMSAVRSMVSEGTTFGLAFVTDAILTGLAVRARKMI
jgi:hypothetical protein